MGLLYLFFFKKCRVSRQIFVKFPVQSFTKIHPVGAALLHADRQTDRQTERETGRRTDITMLKGVVATQMEESSTDRDPV
jgi:hypothetical protein